MGLIEHHPCIFYTYYFVHVGWLHDMILPYDILCRLKMRIGFLIHFSLFHDRTKCMHLLLITSYSFQATWVHDFVASKATATPRRYQATILRLMHLCRAPESPLQMLGKFQDLPGYTIPRKNIEHICLLSYFPHIMSFWECTVLHICAFFSQFFSSYFSFLRDMMD